MKKLPTRPESKAERIARHQFYFDNHKTMTTREMAQALGLKHTAVYKALHTLGIKSKPEEVNTNTRRAIENIDKVSNCDRSLTLQQAAEHLGMTYRLVQRIAKTNGFKFAVQNMSFYRRENPDEAKAWYEARYLTMTNHEMSDELGILAGTVGRNLRIFGLVRPKPIIDKHTKITKSRNPNSAARKAEREAAKVERLQAQIKAKAQHQMKERKRPPKSHLVANNAPTEKVAKLSTSENPVRFKIRDPYDPAREYRYVERIDPNNGRKMLVEVRG